jgi:hypothetical protein
MTFGEAIEALKQGQWVARAGWNGKGMHLFLEDRLSVKVRVGPCKGHIRVYEPCIVMFTAKSQYQPGWLASQADMLADDWHVVAPALPEAPTG